MSESAIIALMTKPNKLSHIQNDYFSQILVNLFISCHITAFNHLKSPMTPLMSIFLVIRY